METILQTPQWPAALSNFVTWCLMWDPRNRPTSAQAMNHEYFIDAHDPLRPKSSTSRILGRKHASYDPRLQKETSESPSTSIRTSWFSRKSLIARDSAPAVPQHTSNTQLVSPNPSPIHASTLPIAPVEIKPRPAANKRATWANGSTPSVGAPMPILPSIRPISPLSNAVTAQARSTLIGGAGQDLQANATPEKGSKKIGRQLSVASHGNHYQESDRSLNGNSGLSSPTNGQKEGFFSHLRKRARRLSGRHQLPISPKYDDLEANVGCAPWGSNRSSMILDPNTVVQPNPKHDFTELDKALQNVRYSLDASSQATTSQNAPNNRQGISNMSATSALKRHHSLAHVQTPRSGDEVHSGLTGPAPISSRTRRALQLSTHPAHRYETPDEEEELLDEALHGVQRAVRGMDRIKKADRDTNSRNALANKDINRQPLQHSLSTGAIVNPYPTPSPSAKRNGMLFTQTLMDEPATPLNIARTRPKEDHSTMWPTPPYEENEWAASAAASIFAAGSVYQ